ncbi:MAG: hypothetical protein QXR60_03885 [Candidatus Nanoarchaeia archaeon]
MQKVVIKLKKIVVDKTDTKNNKFYLTIFYDESGVMQQIKKVYDFEQTTDDFADKLIKEIKEEARKRVCVEEDDDDPLCNYALVMMDEKEEGQQQEKLASALKRLKEKVKNFKSLKLSSDYINKYQELSTLQAEL